MKHRVVIIGSSGMLGIELGARLKRAYDVWGVDIAAKKGSAVRVFRRGDITDGKKIKALLKKIRPDIVVHAAAMTDVDGCERDRSKAFLINGTGTKNVASACAAMDVPFIYISTDFIFNGRKKRPYAESDKPSPLSVYGASKLAGERLVQRICDRYFILRTSWLYGRCGKNFVDTILVKARTEPFLRVVNDQCGSPTYTGDLSAAIGAIIASALSGSGMQYGIYHVSNSGHVTWYGYAKQILKCTGSKTRVVPISSRELNRPARRPAMSVLDTGKLYRSTGHKMRPWKDALKEYLSQK